MDSLLSPCVTRVGHVVGFVCPSGQQETECLIVQFDSMRCSNCKCGRGLVSSTDSPIELQVPLQGPASGLGRVRRPNIGQSVTVQFGEQLFSLMAFLIFGLPLLCAFVGAGLALVVGATAGMQALCALFGALGGWYAARSIGQHLQARAYQSLTLDIEPR